MVRRTRQAGAVICVGENHRFTWDSIESGDPPPLGLVCNCGAIMLTGWRNEMHVVPVFSEVTPLAGVKDGRCEKCSRPLDDPPHKGGVPCPGG